MSTFSFLDEKTIAYVVSSCTQPDAVVSSLIEDTAKVGELAEMLTPIEQAGFLHLIAKLVAPKTVIDVGTFTGLSSLAFARGLAPGGKVITCDVTEDWVGIARKHWELAGVADRIEFKLGPGRKTLPGLVGEGEADLVFIDADKTSYPYYVDAVAPMLRPGGLLILDNTLLHGTVAAPEDVEEDLPRYAAEVVAGVNAKLAVDERFDTVMLPIADGVTLALKK
ncbi:O-methyltransferase [Amycolatopsis sp. cmx-4-61]|uniref:O-methyltransferase n=1 Tax=Amycolatopsis sp. cmx-4-61 TaxID=2790937 RepID=UPI0039786520